MSFKLPPNLETTSDVWESLVRGDVAISGPSSGFKGLPAGYLSPPFDGAAARKAASACGVSGAEASAMDPQHALALSLAAKMWQDAGPLASSLAKADLSRVGVYIGAWQPPASTPQSAYRVLGNSLSALAARVANSYGITGPAITVNTACSSSLVALDAALRDARTGRIDYAIVSIFILCLRTDRLLPRKFYRLRFCNNRLLYYHDVLSHDARVCCFRSYF